MSGLFNLPSRVYAALASSIGASLIGVLQTGAGALAQTVQAEVRAQPVTPQQFGAVGDNVANDSAAFTAMFATGRPWYIPYTAAGYKISTTQVIKSSGVCDGMLIAAAGFVGHLVEICNPVYSTKLNIVGLNVYSTDVRPSPYGAGATLGIYIGPTATYAGNTPCPGVNLWGCRATRFSVGCWISTFNVTCDGCEFPQNDHNCIVYSYDTVYNQTNDVSLINCAMDSAASSVGQAYALRVGTVGNAVYAPNGSLGVNIMVQGCNFDGAPVYLDNILGVSYIQNYHEQGGGYTYFGAAIVMGSAGAGYLQNVLIENCYFTQFYYAIDVVTTCNNTVIKPNFYGSIVYSALRIYATEVANGLRYWNGTAGGSTNWATGYSEVLTNFSAGTGLAQVTFGGLSISNDFLNLGSQVAPSQVQSNYWYPNGLTNDGYRHVTSATGRFRIAAAASSAIAGTQAGNNFTFTTLAQAKFFNGGDRITGTGQAAAATWIKSINYATGVAVLDSTGAGAATITHTVATFLGVNLSGFGTPQGVITANPGSVYTNVAGGANTTLYVKESGTGTNTGWVAK